MPRDTSKLQKSWHLSGDNKYYQQSLVAPQQGYKRGYALSPVVLKISNLVKKLLPVIVACVTYQPFPTSRFIKLLSVVT